MPALTAAAGIALCLFGSALGRDCPPATAGNGTRALIRKTPDMTRPAVAPFSISLMPRDATGTRSAEPGAPDRPAWRWARDSFFKPSGRLRKDKIEHFAASACLYSILRVYEAEEGPSASAVFSTGVLWEGKDAVVPWERFGFWGGDGFSWRDLAADGLGIAAAVLVWRGP
ncbi:MAG: hypothetical protein QUS35_11970 [bacterium]|nr:hypothetical protein [bacterium]